MLIVIIVLSILSSIFISVVIVVILLLVLSVLVISLTLAATESLRSIQLVQDILNLPLQLFVTIAHHLILKHLLHSKGMSLLLEGLAGQN
jgi:hypothetical protein